MKEISSYNNIHNAYLNYNYKVNSKIFNFLAPEALEFSKVLINKSFNRLIVLFENKNNSNEKVLRVYRIEETKNIHDIKFIPR